MGGRLDSESNSSRLIMVNYQAPPAIDIAPWGWNPAATFQTAFNNAEENRRAQEKMAMEQELYKILLPEKIARTEFNLKELAYASKMMEQSYRAQSADLDARYRAATSSGRSGSGSGSNAAGNVVGGTGQQESEDAFDAVPYQGADASGASTPVASDEPRNFPQESTGTRVAAATAEPVGQGSAEMGSNYNFSLAGTPFVDEEPTNPLENLPTDNLSERIAMSSDPSTLGAGSPAGVASIADQSSVPVDMSLTREDPTRGSVGTAPNMLGAENPLERMADAIPDSAPTQQAQAEQARPQSSGDPFYDWSTQTLVPWVQEFKKRSSSLSEQNASGRLKAPAFYSQREQLNQKASAMLASALPKLDSEQSAQYEKLIQSKVEPLDALVQVSTSRPRASAGGKPSVDLVRLETAIKEQSGVLTNLNQAGFGMDSPEVMQVRQNIDTLNRQYGQAIGAVRKPQDNFFQAEADLKLVPVYASKKRPLNGRTDYENVGAELQDAQLAAVREGLANNEDWVIDLTSYGRDATGKLTEEGLQRYQTDVTERRKKHGRVAIFDGQNISVAGPGAGDPKKVARPTTAVSTTQTPDSTEGPDSAKAAAKALRDIGKATGMEDPPHIYAKKMYERYVGKPFTDAAWPWVSTFLRELKQPAGQ